LGHQQEQESDVGSPFFFLEHGEMSDAEKKPRPRSRKKARHGVDAVRESVAKKLLQNADEVAEGLVGKTMEGNVPAFQAAYKVAGEDKAMREALERALRPTRSLATEWASEPEWSGDEAEGMAWWAAQRANLT
jgi:hypothetical protein